LKLIHFDNKSEIKPQLTSDYCEQAALDKQNIKKQKLLASFILSGI